MAWSPPTNLPSTSTRRCASTPLTGRTPLPTRPTTIRTCCWPMFRRRPGPPPPRRPGSAPSSSNPIWMASRCSSMARRSACCKKTSRSALPGWLPANTPCKASRWVTSPIEPRQEMVYPGQESPVNIRILIPRRRNKAAADWLQEGIKFYLKGNEQDYKKAVASFERALAADATYSQAAFYLGRTYSALFDYDNAGRFYKQAIQLDPDYLEARVNYGGALLDTGDVDEAVRQLNTVLQREPAHSVALTLIAQAYRFKALYPQSIEAARQAIRINPKTAEPHLWLADSLRLSDKFAEARPVYDEYLKLSDFDSKLAGKLNYYVLGSLVGMGRKKRVAERDIWNDYHNMAWYGICECERKAANLDAAIADCQKALTYDAKDPFAHYTLGLAFMTKAVNTGSVAELDPALQHFQQVLLLNPDMDEAAIARKNIANIQQYLKQPH